MGGGCPDGMSLFPFFPLLIIENEIENEIVMN